MKLLGPEPRLPRFFVQCRCLMDELRPRVRGVQVDFDDARIRRHLDVIEPRIGIGRRAFDDDRQPKACSRPFDRRNQIEVVLRASNRRHEDVKAALTGLHAQGGSNHARLADSPRRGGARKAPAPRVRARERHPEPRAAERFPEPALVRPAAETPRRGRLQRSPRRPAAPTTEASRAAIDSRSANRRESETSALVVGATAHLSIADPSDHPRDADHLRDADLADHSFLGRDADLADHSGLHAARAARTRRHGRGPARTPAPAARGPLRSSAPTSAGRRSPAAAARCRR